MALAMDINSKKVSKLAMERFRMENGVEVYIIRWLGRLRPSGQYILVVIKVATKENIEKLLRLNSVLFSRGMILVLLFKEQYTPVACFKYKRFGYKAKDCMRSNICNIYSQKGYL